MVRRHREKKICDRQRNLDKYIDLNNSRLTKVEKTQVRDLLYKYKDAFSLRDEIGPCPNIKIEINVTDKSPFFIRPFHANEEDKNILDKEMKPLCYLGILKEAFSAYSSPVMLISRKMIKDKRVVTDFRHLNMCIAKNNLAYPLFKDTFSMLGSSNCEVMSVLDLKDDFHSLKAMTHTTQICGIFDIANLLQYHAGFAPMLFQWSLSHMQCFLLQIHCNFLQHDFFTLDPFLLHDFCAILCCNWFNCCMFYHLYDSAHA